MQFEKIFNYAGWGREFFDYRCFCGKKNSLSANKTLPLSPKSLECELSFSTGTFLIETKPLLICSTVGKQEKLNSRFIV